MAPIIHELKVQKVDFQVCVTAQHREMLDQVLEFFDIVPDFDLNLMKPGQSLNLLSGLILGELDVLLEKTNPDIILVQGDTTTAFIASLAAFNRGIKIGHIEAGLRTGNLQAPFPEEANRQLISRIAHFHFVPTVLNRKNLLKEGIAKNKIFLTGNTVIDALFMAREKLWGGYENDEIRNLQKLLREDKKLLLVTGHRRESFGKGLNEICNGLLDIAEREDVQIIFPVHLNPMVRTQVFEALGNHSSIHLIEPLGYPAFLLLMIHARVIISDSGGIQEEAPALKKPVIVTRETTEREEAVAAGFSYLVGTSREKLGKKLKKLLDEPPDFANTQNPYGNGSAAQTILEILKKGNA